MDTERFRDTFETIISNQVSARISLAVMAGFTLLELIVVIAIVGALAAIGIPAYSNHIESAKVAKAIAEIYMLEKEIQAFEVGNGRLPDTLAEIGRQNLNDPWGNPYQYLNFNNVQGKGKMRKNKFQVPLNQHFDLYSKGRDGQSQPPLTAKASYDDIIRADDGQYIGLASNY